MTVVLGQRQKHCSSDTSEFLVNVLLNQCSRKKNIYIYIKVAKIPVWPSEDHVKCRVFTALCALLATVLVTVSLSSKSCVYTAPACLKSSLLELRCWPPSHKPLPALLAQLSVLVATSPPCLASCCSSARRKKESSYPPLLSGADVQWKPLTGIRSPRIPVDLMAHLVLLFLLFVLC